MDRILHAFLSELFHLIYFPGSPLSDFTIIEPNFGPICPIPKLWLFKWSEIILSPIQLKVMLVESIEKKGFEIKTKNDAWECMF